MSINSESPLQDDPDIQAAYDTIVLGLAKGLSQNPHGRDDRRPRHDTPRNELRIKCEYQGEKR